MEELRSLDLQRVTTDEFRPFVDAVNRGFNEGPVTNNRQVELLLDLARRDRTRQTGIWDDAAGMAEMPVATFKSWDATVNVGGGSLVLADFISGVTVRPTHKRRGYLRRLMTQDLAAARERGVPLATLTASDTQIYGRFGFGRASLDRAGELALGPKFGLRVFPTGRRERVAPQEVLEDRNRLYTKRHLAQRGSHARPASYDVLDWDFNKASEDLSLEALAHYDESGAIDGVAYYRMMDKGETIKLLDLQAASANAELGLWKVLGSTELVEKITIGALDPNSALPWALRDPRSLKQTLGADHIWWRILDLPAAIAARGFSHDGRAVLEVHDPLEYASGVYEIEAAGGRAQARRSSAKPDAILDVADLAGLYSGLSDARLLAAIGTITADTAGAHRVHTLFSVPDQPWTQCYF